MTTIPGRPIHHITVWGFSRVPDFAQGLVRDLRVRWALEEAGIPYDVRLVESADRHSEAFRRISPFGKVPAIEADGSSLFESGAILCRIAEATDDLIPGDAAARAETLAWMFAALNTVEPPVDALLAMDLQHGGEDWVRQRRPAVVEQVRGQLRPLASRLDGRDYLAGAFSAADILMTTVLRLIRHTDLVAELPMVDRYLKRCEARPAFQAALSRQLADYARPAPVAA